MHRIPSQSLIVGTLPRDTPVGSSRGRGRVGVWLGLLCLAMAGCRPSPKEAVTDPVVAEVAGRPILASRLALELERRSGGGRLPVDRDKVLEELIDLEAAFSKASSNGFLDRPEIQQAIRLMVVERFRDQWEQDHPAPPALSDDRVRESYARQTNRFVRPEGINLAMIRLESPRKAAPERRADVVAKAETLAERARRELGPLSHFGPIAAESSTDQPTRYRGGELGWMTPAQLGERLPPEVAAAALGLRETGAVSAPVVAPDAVYLVRLMGRRPAAQRPVDEVRSQIEHELMKEARVESDRRWSGESRAGLVLQIHREALEKVALPKPKPETPEAPAPMVRR